MRHRSIALAALLALALPATADAARKPTEKERKAILAGVDEGRKFSCAPAYPPRSCRRVVRISTVRPGWAAVRILPRRGYEGAVQPDTMSARRNDGAWRRHQVGNGGGCGVPADVVRDLKLACY